MLSLLLPVMALSACGFSPLYGTLDTNGAPTTRNIASILSSIYINPIPERIGQILRDDLQKGMGIRNRGNVPAAYKLTVALSESIQTLAVAKNAFATRANLYLSAKYTLSQVSDPSQTINASARTISSYNILTSDYATLTAQANARKLATLNLSKEIQTRLAVLFRFGNDLSGPPTP